MAAVFPGAVPTTAGLFGALVNNCANLLNGALTIGATSIVVDDTSSFPASGYATIHKADLSGSYEIFQYTGKSSTTFTGVTRGVGGTSAAAWNDEDVVSLFWVADHHNHTCEEIIAIAQNIVNRFGLNTNIVLGAGITITLPAGTNLRLTTPDGTHVYEFGIDNNANFGIQNQIS